MDYITVVLSKDVPFHVQAVFSLHALKLYSKVEGLALREHPAFIPWLMREGRRFVDGTEREWLDHVEKETYGR